MKRIVEIRGAEGGEDASLFAQDLSKAYQRMFARFGWKFRVAVRDSEITIEVTGDNLDRLDQESGGHRVQRVPPTERKGRVHTSTVTVAVLADNAVATTVRDTDLRIEWFSGTGAGGQHRNKTQNSCRLIHLPSGHIATASTRSRQNSYKLAREAIVQRVTSQANASQHHQLAAERKSQVGSGMRGDKIRTYRFQDDQVKDHRSGKTSSCGTVLNGYFDLLWY